MTGVTEMTADWMAGVLRGDRPEALSPMVVTALPDPARPEAGQRVIAAGRQAAAAALARDALGRGRREPVFCCAQRDRAAIEFAEASPDGTRRSSIVTMQLAAGSITRIVAFRHTYVPRLAGPGTAGTPAGAAGTPADAAGTPADAAGTPADAAQLLVRRYLDDLEAGRAAEAAGCFAEDAIYSFPPRTADGDRGVVTGRSAITSVFEARGTNAARHHIEQVTGNAAGTDFVISGRVTGLPAGQSATFASCVQVAAGLISRYVAVMCVPEVPQRTGETS
jgi:ketosteroid isomerase-like protein